MLRPAYTAPNLSFLAMGIFILGCAVNILSLKSFTEADSIIHMRLTVPASAQIVLQLKSRGFNYNYTRDGKHYSGIVHCESCQVGDKLTVLLDKDNPQISKVLPFNPIAESKKAEADRKQTAGVVAIFSLFGLSALLHSYFKRAEILKELRQLFNA